MMVNEKTVDGKVIKFVTPEIVKIMDGKISNEVIEIKDKHDCLYKITSEPVYFHDEKMMGIIKKSKPCYFVFGSVPFTLKVALDKATKECKFKMDAVNLATFTKSTLLNKLFSATLDNMQIIMLIVTFIAGAGLGYIGHSMIAKPTP